ncbi:MAG: putative bifunctional diguanylate cyclase/phosphodiesterase [Pusillimonas sp.]
MSDSQPNTLSKCAELLSPDESLFRALAENAVIGVYLIRHNRFLFVNTKLTEILGYSRDEMLGEMSLFDIVAHDEKHLVESHVTRTLSGEISEFHYERKARKKDGSFIDVEVYASAMRQGPDPVLIGLMLDVTQRKADAESAHLASLVYKHSSEAMVITDANGVIVTVNPSFSDITGYPLDEVVGQRLNILSSGRHPEAFYREMWGHLVKTGKWRGEIWNRRKNGQEYVENLVINTSYNDDGSVRCRIGVFSDITAKKENEQFIWRQANYDYLTGLPNRKLLEDRLGVELARAHRSQTEVALVFLDLDFFKEVNDTLGHAMGDDLLRQVARRLTQCVREADTVARLGGDEFVIIASGITDRSVVRRICEQVLQSLAKPYRLKEQTAYVSASVGVAFYPGDASDAERLMRHADLAMYAAKDAGRSQFRFYDVKMHEAVRERWKLARDLLGALEKNEFELHYQPVIDMKSGRIAKAEALIRWRHPERGFVSPAMFIPFAEDNGLIINIGNWVFEEATRQLVQWRSMGYEDFNVGINVSPVQLRGEGLDHVKWLQHLADAGLPPGNLVVELTERVLMDVAPIVTEKLLGFRDAGVQVALDDFGTGYSSLSYLKKFDIDFLKIDQSFVRNLSIDSEDMALCEAMIMMAHKLGLQVIAEGVETPMQRDLLMGIGCDFGQGYLFSRPVPPDEFTRLLAQGPISLVGGE